MPLSDTPRGSVPGRDGTGSWTCFCHFFYCHYYRHSLSSVYPFTKNRSSIGSLFRYRGASGGIRYYLTRNPQSKCYALNNYLVQSGSWGRPLPSPTTPSPARQGSGRT